jgi:hypothetical protein
MCDNMVVSDVCVVSKVWYSVFYGHYTESNNCLVSDEVKGRHAHAMNISHLRKRETCQCDVRLTS